MNISQAQAYFESVKNDTESDAKMADFIAKTNSFILKASRKESGNTFIYFNNSEKIVYDSNEVNKGKVFKDIAVYKTLAEKISPVSKGGTGGLIDVGGQSFVFTFVRMDKGGYILLTPASRQFSAMGKMITQLVLMFIILMAIIALVLYFTFKRNITRPIYRIVKEMDKVSQGDLTVNIRIKGSDEISNLGDRFNNMIREQKKMQIDIKSAVDNLKIITQSITTAAKINKESMSSLSIESSSITQSVENSKAAMQSSKETVSMIASAVDSTAASAASTAEHTGDIYNEIEEGINNVKTSFESMKNLQNASAYAKDAIGRLSEHTQKITKITSTISSIANQTNLLALNASIEAARAGEAGKGFSVVADEIRKLAENSNAAARDIQQLINSVVNDTGEAVEKVDVTFHCVDVSVQYFGQIERIFSNMKARIQEISSMIMHIASSTQEQSSSVEELNSNTAIIANNETSISSDVFNMSKEIEKQEKQLSDLAIQSMHLEQLMQRLNESTEKYVVD
jgi:methyl-accepting chemotaxis protein